MTDNLNSEEICPACGGDGQDKRATDIVPGATPPPSPKCPECNGTGLASS
jgi:DnaJ-class molecular chaperone